MRLKGKDMKENKKINYEHNDNFKKGSKGNSPLKEDREREAKEKDERQTGLQYSFLHIFSHSQSLTLF